MRMIFQMIEEVLGALGVVFSITDGADPIDREFSVVRDFRRRHPYAPRDAARPSSGTFRISEFPAAPPA